MDTLLIGGYYPPELIATFKANTKGSLDYAANNLQEAIIDGFRQNSHALKVLSAPYLGSFPLYYKTPRVPGFSSPDKSIESIPYLNVCFFKRSIIRSKQLKKAKEWCANHIDGTILLYNFSCLSIASEIKVQFPRIKIVILVTDLPRFMSVTDDWMSRLNSFISPDISTNSFAAIDGFILLSEKMTDSLPVDNKPWMLLEGIFNDRVTTEIVGKSPYKSILYSGNLGRRYGIMDLVEAFHRIPFDNYRLLFCGAGDSLESIREYQKTDSRIQYLGVLDRHEVVMLQKSATILVNPRHKKDEYTKYSFPSKTMEYMASGTPVLMSKLECLPDDYLKHLHLFEDESIEGMSRKIVDVCEKDSEELADFGKKASQFIVSSKCPKAQAERIISFIESL